MGWDGLTPEELARGKMSNPREWCRSHPGRVIRRARKRASKLLEFQRRSIEYDLEPEFSDWELAFSWVSWFNDHDVDCDDWWECQFMTPRLRVSFLELMRLT